MPPVGPQRTQQTLHHRLVVLAVYAIPADLKPPVLQRQLLILATCVLTPSVRVVSQAWFDLMIGCRAILNASIVNSLVVDPTSPSRIPSPLLHQSFARANREVRRLYSGGAESRISTAKSGLSNMLICYTFEAPQDPSSGSTQPYHRDQDTQLT